MLDNWWTPTSCAATHAAQASDATPLTEDDHG
jgi:hypothetical protein